VPLLWISLCFTAGLVLGMYLPWAGAGWLTLGIAWLVLTPLLPRLPLLAQPAPFARGALLLERLRWLGQRDPRLLVSPAALLAALFLGAARIAFHGPDLANGHVAIYNDQGRFRLQGVVATPPEQRDRSTLLRLSVESVAALDETGQPGEARPAHGLLLAVMPPGSPLQYGDRLALDGSPVTPPGADAEGEFSYRDYLVRQGIYAYLTFPLVRRLESDAGNPLLAGIFRIRDWGYDQIYHLFPAPEAPLLAGILLGMDDDMPPDLSKAYRDTGTAHIIAISGHIIAIKATI
jgi:competence protein ComEC